MVSEAEGFFHKTNRLQQLRAFCYAAQFGNISKASKYMGLTASTLSVHIKSLEEDMACTLFDRHGPRISLTEDGREFLKMAIPLVEGMLNLKDRFHKRSDAKQKKTIRIAVNATIKNYIAPALISQYLSKYQETQVELFQSEHHEALEQIRGDAVDLAILPRRAHLAFPADLEYEPIYRCKPCYITLPEHPLAGRSKLTIEEIKQYPLTIPPQDLEVIPGLARHFGDMETFDHRILFRNTETGREFVEAGLVATISSDVWLRPNDLLIGTLLSHLFPEIDYGAVYKTSKKESKNLRKLLGIGHRHAKERAAWITRKYVRQTKT